MGPNGAGKTTLINAVAGVLRRKPAGSSSTEGTSPTLPPHRVCEAGLAIVPEGRRIFRGMSVRDNLELGAFPAGGSASDTLRSTGPRALSGAARAPASWLAASRAASSRCWRSGEPSWPAPACCSSTSPRSASRPSSSTRSSRSSAPSMCRRGVLLVEQNVPRAMEDVEPRLRALGRSHRRRGRARGVAGKARDRARLPRRRRRTRSHFASTERLSMLFPTTIVGSFPQPEWLIDRARLAGRFPPRVRALEFCNSAAVPGRGPGRCHPDRDPRPGGAGLEIVSDGEIRREAIRIASPPRSRASTSTTPARPRPLGPSQSGAADRRQIRRRGRSRWTN